MGDQPTFEGRALGRLRPSQENALLNGASDLPLKGKPGRPRGSGSLIVLQLFKKPGGADYFAAIHLPGQRRRVRSTGLRNKTAAAEFAISLLKSETRPNR